MSDDASVLLRRGRPPIEISVVMPCLNEEVAISSCIREARGALDGLGVTGEVIVVDNGSTDGSAAIAESLGARVVTEPSRGYGRAYLTGLREARGRYVVMADSDGTYDLGALGAFVEPLGNGTEMVIGTRLRGMIEPGAMPWLHRYVGNPLLTGLVNAFFKAGISDVHCGMRAVKRDSLGRLDLSAPGMEFASELVIEATRHRLTMRELPIRYSRRVGGRPKLRTWRDGWRHLRLILRRALRESRLGLAARRHASTDLLSADPSAIAGASRG